MSPLSEVQGASLAGGNAMGRICLSNYATQNQFHQSDTKVQYTLNLM